MIYYLDFKVDFPILIVQLSASQVSNPTSPDWRFCQIEFWIFFWPLGKNGIVYTDPLKQDRSRFLLKNYFWWLKLHGAFLRNIFHKKKTNSISSHYFIFMNKFVDRANYNLLVNIHIWERQYNHKFGFYKQK